MKKNKQLKFKRLPSKAELRHIATRIWGLWIDFDSLREFGDTDQFYSDVIDVINGKTTIDLFSDEYVCDTYDDLSFDLFYNTARYLIKKGIIDKL